MANDYGVNSKERIRHHIVYHFSQNGQIKAIIPSTGFTISFSETFVYACTYIRCTEFIKNGLEFCLQSVLHYLCSML